MYTIERPPIGRSPAWSHEFSLATMPVSRFAARMLDFADVHETDPFPVTAHIEPDAAQIPLGHAANYFIALDLLEIALEYANFTGCLRIRFSLAPRVGSVEGSTPEREIHVCMLWDCCAAKTDCCAQAQHRSCRECAGTIPFPAYSEAESMHHRDARVSTILVGNDEVGLKMAWPVNEEESSNPHWIEPLGIQPTSLIVDHNPAHLEYLRMILEDGGFATESAGSSEAAIELVRSRAEAIQLAVINASPMHAAAVEVVRALRNESPTTRVVLTSACSLLEIARGLHGYPLLREPISPLQLLTTASHAVLTQKVGAMRPGVLIADDEPSIRGLIRMALAAEGYDIMEAGNGDEAALALQCHDIDVVLLDLVMPDKEGLETIRSIKNKITPVSVVAMSGASGEYLMLAKHLGADVTLKKPLVTQELVDGVKLALAIKAERIAKSALESWSMPSLCGVRTVNG